MYVDEIFATNMYKQKVEGHKTGEISVLHSNGKITPVDHNKLCMNHIIPRATTKICIGTRTL